MSPRKKSVLFLADPWHTLDHEQDSTLCLAKAGIEEFGLTVYWAHPENVYFSNGAFYTQVEGTLQISTQNDKVILAPQSQSIKLADLQSVHWRKDPPVDLTTLRVWALLANASDKIKMYNSPKALLAWNEKFSSLRFKNAMQSTCITDNHDVALTFVKENAQHELLLKPSSEAASRGVRFLPKDLAAAKNAILETQKNSGPWVVIQKFNPAIIKHGETRIFLLGGKIAGALLKKPRPNAAIMNFDLAGENSKPSIEQATPNATQKKIALEIGAAMKKEGIFFATVDFIQNQVLEINVTSPGLLKTHMQQCPDEKPMPLKYWQLILK